MNNRELIIFGVNTDFGSESPQSAIARRTKNEK